MKNNPFVNSMVMLGLCIFFPVKTSEYHMVFLEVNGHELNFFFSCWQRPECSTNNSLDFHLICLLCVNRNNRRELKQTHPARKDWRRTRIYPELERTWGSNHHNGMWRRDWTIDWSHWCKLQPVAVTFTLLHSGFLFFYKIVCQVVLVLFIFSVLSFILNWILLVVPSTLLSSLVCSLANQADEIVPKRRHTVFPDGHLS